MRPAEPKPSYSGKPRAEGAGRCAASDLTDGRREALLRAASSGPPPLGPSVRPGPHCLRSPPPRRQKPPRDAPTKLGPSLCALVAFFFYCFFSSVAFRDLRLDLNNNNNLTPSLFLPKRGHALLSSLLLLFFFRVAGCGDFSAAPLQPATGPTDG